MRVRGEGNTSFFLPLPRISDIPLWGGPALRKEKLSVAVTLVLADVLWFWAPGMEAEARSSNNN